MEDKTERIEYISFIKRKNLGVERRFYMPKEWKSYCNLMNVAKETGDAVNILIDDFHFYYQMIENLGLKVFRMKSSDYLPLHSQKLFRVNGFGLAYKQHCNNTIRYINNECEKFIL